MILVALSSVICWKELCISFSHDDQNRKYGGETVERCLSSSDNKVIDFVDSTRESCKEGRLANKVAEKVAEKEADRAAEQQSKSNRVRSTSTSWCTYTPLGPARARWYPLLQYTLPQLITLWLEQFYSWIHQIVAEFVFYWALGVRLWSLG